MKREPKFKTEADLCAAFIAMAQKDGWVSYAETHSWDILLVGKDGVQIGIQAKLKFNLQVLSQAVESPYGYWDHAGPDFRAVLVPECGGHSLCSALGMTMIFASGPSFCPSLPSSRYGAPSDWHYLNPLRRHELPKYIPDVVAGSSAPIQLTKWKIGALRIAAILELRGFVTRKDFSINSIDHRRFIASDGWLIAGAEAGQFIVKPGNVLDYTKGHPIVYEQVKADIATELKAEAEMALKIAASK